LPPQPALVQSAPPPAIAVNTPPPAGSYVVQVAAQKSEGEAQASWQSLQQRYSSVLGAQQATIRRVDLGERGVFYRAQVGPFSTRAQASEVCQSLKAAGGECVIQRN
jgi:cell division septation protein DedD